MGEDEGRDKARILLGGEEKGMAAVLRELVVWVGRMLREEDQGTAVCSVEEMLGEGVGLD